MSRTNERTNERMHRLLLTLTVSSGCVTRRDTTEADADPSSVGRIDGDDDDDDDV
jgi:hypothetical protein